MLQKVKERLHAVERKTGGGRGGFGGPEAGSREQT